MKTIITISRQYGSGGREIGRKLAEQLGVPFYDNEIISRAAKETGFSEAAFETVEDKATNSLLYSIAMGMNVFTNQDAGFAGLSLDDRIFLAQSNVIRKVAEEGGCVIVGRCADVILKDYHPLNLFVYADAESKIQRCIDRAPEGEHLSRNDIARRMKQVDKNRAQYRQMFADNKWGAKETYHLCVNTSGHEIKDLIPGLAAFVRCWFGEK